MHAHADKKKKKGQKVLMDKKKKNGDDNGNGKAWHVRGCTQLSFDPKIRRIYMGNAFDGMSKVVESAMVPAHQKYTIFLLEGLVEDLEMSAQESVHNN